jgi:hypothetical protein
LSTRSSHSLFFFWIDTVHTGTYSIPKFDLHLAQGKANSNYIDMYLEGTFIRTGCLLGSILCAFLVASVEVEGAATTFWLIIAIYFPAYLLEIQ